MVPSTLLLSMNNVYEHILNSNIVIIPWCILFSNIDILMNLLHLCLLSFVGFNFIFSFWKLHLTYFICVCVFWALPCYDVSVDSFRESVLPFHPLAWVISFNNKLSCSPFCFVFDVKSSFGSYRTLIMWTPRCQYPRMCMFLIQIDTTFGGDDFFSQMSFAQCLFNSVDAEPLHIEVTGCVLWKCLYWILVISTPHCSCCLPLLITPSSCQQVKAAYCLQELKNCSFTFLMQAILIKHWIRTRRKRVHPSFYTFICVLLQRVANCDLGPKSRQLPDPGSLVSQEWVTELFTHSSGDIHTTEVTASSFERDDGFPNWKYWLFVLHGEHLSIFIYRIDFISDNNWFGVNVACIFKSNCPQIVDWLWKPRVISSPFMISLSQNYLFINYSL